MSDDGDDDTQDRPPHQAEVLTFNLEKAKSERANKKKHPHLNPVKKTPAEHTSGPTIGAREQEPPWAFMQALPAQTYDIGLIREFMGHCFRALPLGPDENIACWALQQPGGKPIKLDAFENKLLPNYGQTKNPAYATYFSLSTFRHDPNEDFAAKKTFFVRMYGFMFDDIGDERTLPGVKYPISKFPKDLLKGSVQIETSPSNYQIFVLLAEPITDLQLAQALVKVCILHTNLGDSGGVNPTRRVRLIEGVHGKRPPKDVDLATAQKRATFKTRVVHMGDRLWHPQELLDELGVTLTTWDALQADPQGELFKLGLTRAKVKANRDPRLPTYRPPSDFDLYDELFTDPIVRVLAEEGFLLSDEVLPGGWLQIRCPKGDKHSNGDDTAYFSPYGEGDSPDHQATRALYCHHGHKDPATGEVDRPTMADLLLQLYERTGRWHSVQDPAYYLTRIYVVLEKKNALLKLKADGWPIPLGAKPQDLNAIAGKQEHLPPPDENGKIPVFDRRKAFLNSENLIVVHDVTSRPDIDQPFFRDDETGEVMANLYHFKPAIVGKLSAKHKEYIELFKRYMTHLFTIPEQRKIILYMLARKIKEPTFRGWGVLMVSKNGRVGRDTLGTIFELIFDSHYENVDEEDLFSRFSEHRTKLLTYTGELALDHKSTIKRYRRRLRELVDSTVKKGVRINPKSMPQYIAIDCSMRFFAINSMDTATGLIADNDNRMYVVQNPNDMPLENIPLLKAVKKAIGTDGEIFGQAVTTYLALEVYSQINEDVRAVLDGFPPNTTLKTTMKSLTSNSTKDKLFAVFLDCLPGGLMDSALFADAFFCCPELQSFVAQNWQTPSLLQEDLMRYLGDDVRRLGKLRVRVEKRVPMNVKLGENVAKTTRRYLYYKYNAASYDADIKYLIDKYATEREGEELPTTVDKCDNDIIKELLKQNAIHVIRERLVEEYQLAGN